MDQNHKDGCGECAACLFEKEIEAYQNKKQLRVLDTGNLQGNAIEDACNAIEADGYDLIAVDHGMAYFRARPPQLPPELARGIQIVKASDIMGDKGGGPEGGFSDDDIGEPIK